MEILRINLFGSLRVSTSDLSVPLRLTPVIQGLFAYLLLNPSQPQPRDVLAELFWGNYSQVHARGCLNTALWRLRRLLEPGHTASEGLYLLSNSQGDVVFNLNSPHWIDVEEFQVRVTNVLDRPVEAASDEDVEACCQAVSLYTGDLLEGIYDDWAIRQRERTRLMYISALSWLGRYYWGQRAFEKSLVYARRILELDPLREEIQCEVMRLYMLSGQRTLALRQYEICRKVLLQEMDIPPMEETTELYYQILNSEGPVTTSIPVTGKEDGTLSVVMTQFHKARQTLDQAQEQFRMALQALERIQPKDE